MDITAIPVESLIAIPALAAAIYIAKKKTKRPSIVVKKTTYDRETNKIIMHIENKKPMCYSLKSMIKVGDIQPEINVESGMMPARAIDGPPGTMLIAEDRYPIVIGPNELIEVSYTPIVPRDFLDQYSLTNLDVNISFSKYEDVQNVVSKEIFEGKLKERLEKLKPPKFGIIIDEKRTGSSIVYENVIEYNIENEHMIEKSLMEFDKIETLNETIRYSLGTELAYFGSGTKVGRNTIMWFADLRRTYPTILSNDETNTYNRQP